MDRRDRANNVFRSLRIPKLLYAEIEISAQRRHITVASLLLQMLSESAERDPYIQECRTKGATEESYHG